MEIGIVLGVLKAGLDLWNNHESNKYRDRLIKLEKSYYEELAKPFDNRSQLELDRVLFEINLIAKNFVRFSTKKP